MRRYDLRNVYVFNPAFRSGPGEPSIGPDAWLEVAEMIGMEAADVALYAECVPHIIVYVDTTR